MLMHEQVIRQKGSALKLFKHFHRIALRGGGRGRGRREGKGRGGGGRGETRIGRLGDFTECGREGAFVLGFAATMPTPG